MAALNRHYTRVAVVQLDVLPAAVLERRTPLEDPLFEFGKPDSLQRGDGTIPADFEERFKLLRARIRQVYAAQLKLKLLAILDACRRWKVRLVVFPEYSIPYEILGPISDASGEMVIVAGTHAVEREGLKSGLYQKLGWHGDAERPLPIAGQAVCPVLYQGRLLALQPKLHAAKPEEGSLKKGKFWSPVELPALPSPMGVLICLDFLSREDAQHRDLVGEPLSKCRFLAVPSLTPSYTIDEFGSAAWTEARHYGRPVLYANVAGRMGAGRADLGGGSSIFVDEGSPLNLRQFPKTAGILDPGNEGVIVADVDLGYDDKLKPSSTHYDSSRPIQPIAAASLVYRRHPVSDSYANFVEQFLPRLAERTEDDSIDDLVEELQSQRDLLLQAGAFTGCETRNRRLQEMFRGLDRINSARELEKFTSEVVLPADVLPLPDLRSVLALSAADVLDSWIKDQRGTGLHEVEERLRKAGKTSQPTSADWDENARTSALKTTECFRDLRVEQPLREIIQVVSRVELPSGLSPASLPPTERDGLRVVFGEIRSEPLRALPDDWEFDDSVIPPSQAEGTEFSGVEFTRIRAFKGTEKQQLLAIAERRAQPTLLGIWIGKDPNGVAAVMWNEGDQWNVTWPLHSIWEPLKPHHSTLEALLHSVGLNQIRIAPVTVAEVGQQIDEIYANFQFSESNIGRLRDLRLREVGGEFFEPFVDTSTSHVLLKRGSDESGEAGQTQLATEALDEWLKADFPKLLLLLGQFGTGKSTLLAEWSSRLCDRYEHDPQAVRPVLCNLAGSEATDPWSLLLESMELEDTEANRASIELLILTRKLLPIFDGFDEMATRVTPEELPERLRGLLSVAGLDGRVVISSRDHYFPTEGALKSATDRALTKTLGVSSGVRRLTLQLLDQTQVERFVKQVLQDSGEADEALAKIAALYPLQDLVRRPLLLGMVLQTRDQFEAGARISQAGLYEAYLNRWLEQTDAVGSEIFNRDQKKRLAEEIAWDLWKSGEATLSVEHLQDLIRDTLNRDLPSDVPFDAAFLEAFGGTFFVREGEDRFRFAHKSFLEFFLARVLVRTLPSQPQKMLDTRPLTREVCAFVGELLRRDGDWQQSKVVLSVSEWLRSRNKNVGRALLPVASNETASGFESEKRRAGVPILQAAANALRLLLGLSRWADLQLSIGTDHAGLCGVDLSGEDLTGVDLRGADLCGALLSRAQLIDADLTGAVLDDARLNGAIVSRTSLANVQAARTDFRQASIESCSVETASLCDADFSQSSWTNCPGQPSVVSGTTNFATVLASDIMSPFLHAPDAALAAIRPRLQAGHSGGTRSVCWSPDSRQFASADDVGTVCVWDAATGAAVARLEGHQRWVLTVSWSPDGRQLASGGYDGTVRVWDAATGATVSRLEGHQRWVLTVSWSPDGRQLASGGQDGTVFVWDTATGAAVAQLDAHQGSVKSLSWSPDGCQLASAGYDRTVRVWDAPIGARVARLDGHEGQVNFASWSPDGRQFASADDEGTVCVWDASTWAAYTRLGGREGGVLSVSWSPDGLLLIASGSDGTIRVWDASTEATLLQLEGLKGGVRSIGWSPDGRQVAISSYDYTIGVWDATTGAALTRIESHNNLVLSVRWSPGCRHIASKHGHILSDRQLEVLHYLAIGHSVKDVAKLMHISVKNVDSHKYRILQTLVTDNGGTTLVWNLATGECLDSAAFDHAMWDVVARMKPRLKAKLLHSGCIPIYEDGELLATFEFFGSTTLARTRSGYFRVDGDGPIELGVAHPDCPGSTLCLPLHRGQPLFEVLHRPDLVAAELQGLPVPSLEEEFAKRGWELPRWDGKVRRIDSRIARAEGDARIEIAASEPIVVFAEFSPGPPLDFAPGREAVLENLCEKAQAKTAVRLLCPRRSGKTTLLNTLRQRLTDAGWTVRQHSLEGFSGRTPNALAVFLQPDLEGDRRAWKKFSTEVLSQPQTALLLDEIVHLQKASSELQACLRQLSQDRVCALVYAGTQGDWSTVMRQVQRTPGSTFGNDTYPLEPDALAATDAAEFLRSVFKAQPDFGPVLAAAPTADWIVEVSDGWPYYLQVLGDAVVRSAKQGQRQAFVERAGVVDLYEQRLLGAYGQNFERRFTELEPEARQILLREVERILTEFYRGPMADSEQPSFSRLSGSELKIVQDNGLGRVGSGWLRDRPFYDWLNRNRRMFEQPQSRIRKGTSKR